MEKLAALDGEELEALRADRRTASAERRRGLVGEERLNGLALDRDRSSGRRHRMSVLRSQRTASSMQDENEDPALGVCRRVGSSRSSSMNTVANRLAPSPPRMPPPRAANRSSADPPFPVAAVYSRERVAVPSLPLENFYAGVLPSPSQFRVDMRRLPARSLLPSTSFCPRVAILQYHVQSGLLNQFEDDIGELEIPSEDRVFSSMNLYYKKAAVGSARSACAGCGQIFPLDVLWRRILRDGMSHLEKSADFVSRWGELTPSQKAAQNVVDVEGTLMAMARPLVRETDWTGL